MCIIQSAGLEVQAETVTQLASEMEKIKFVPIGLLSLVALLNFNDRDAAAAHKMAAVDSAEAK